MGLRAIGDTVIAKPDENSVQRITPAGIIIPEIAQERSQVAEVVAVGRGRRAENGKRIPVGLSRGDKILYRQYAGKVIGEHVILKPVDIYAVLVDTK